jgi:hypothetical protein
LCCLSMMIRKTSAAEVVYTTLPAIVEPNSPGTVNRAAIENDRPMQLSDRYWRLQYFAKLPIPARGSSGDLPFPGVTTIIFIHRKIQAKVARQKLGVCRLPVTYEASQRRLLSPCFIYEIRFGFVLPILGKHNYKVCFHLPIFSRSRHDFRASRSAAQKQLVVNAGDLAALVKEYPTLHGPGICDRRFRLRCACPRHRCQSKKEPRRDWAEKPVDSMLTIPVEIHEAVMALPPDERRDRAKVNEAVRDGLKLGPLRPAGTEDRYGVPKAIGPGPGDISTTYPSKLCRLPDIV